MAENYFGATDPGRQRGNNEDTFIAETVLRNGYIAAAVIDGVGGYEGGEVAAELARSSILDYFSVPSGSMTTMMQEALVAANEKIVREKQNHPKYEKMACVVTLVLLEKGSNKFYYAHVGDTRLYLFRDGSLVKVTKDHSFVGFLEDSGRLDEASAMTHPKRNEINKALGFEAPLQNPSDYIETGDSPFLPGDLLLLCSDCLTDMIDKAKISNILSGNDQLSVKAHELIKAANDAGGKDNITVVLIQNDQIPVKVQATKPLKKNEIADEVIPERVNQKITSQKGPSRSSSRIVFFLSFLVLLLIGLFVWQRLQNRSQQATRNNQGRPLQSLKVFNGLQDTLDHLVGNQLDLVNTTLGDVIFLPDTIWIRQDSLSLHGSAGIILTADSASHDNSVIMVTPNVRYFQLDSLTIQDINILVPAASGQVVHFNQTRFQNASFSRYYLLADTLLTGTLESRGIKDSLQKGAKIK